MQLASRVRFEKSLAQLTEDVVHLGGLARCQVAFAMKALADSDLDLAREVIVGDTTVNQIRFDVEANIYTLLAPEQPVAGDLRAIVSALSITNDLERIADHGKKIAGVHLRLDQEPRTVPLGDIPHLGKMALSLFDRALRTLVNRDVAEARAVCAAYDDVDAQYKQTFNIILSYMLEDPRTTSPGTHLLQVAHELERVGDRATNIAERVIYTATGELLDLNL